MREVRRRGADTAPLERALLWAVPAGIVGARADYVISHPHEFSSLGQVLALWHGGLALFGGLIAGLSVGVIVAHRAGIYAIRLLDAAAPSIALAIAVGRIGDLLLLDHLGKPAASAWALAYRVQLGSQLAPGSGRARPSLHPVVHRAPTLASSMPAALITSAPAMTCWAACCCSRSCCCFAVVAVITPVLCSAFGRSGTALNGWRWTSLGALTSDPLRALPEPSCWR
jgi:hypothetical protein